MKGSWSSRITVSYAILLARSLLIPASSVFSWEEENDFAKSSNLVQENVDSREIIIKMMAMLSRILFFNRNAPFGFEIFPIELFSNYISSKNNLNKKNFTAIFLVEL
jgi:hypothetical protein